MIGSNNKTSNRTSDVSDESNVTQKSAEMFAEMPPAWWHWMLENSYRYNEAGYKDNRDYIAKWRLRTPVETWPGTHLVKKLLRPDGSCYSFSNHRECPTASKSNLKKFINFKSFVWEDTPYYFKQKQEAEAQESSDGEYSDEFDFDIHVSQRSLGLDDLMPIKKRHPKNDSWFYFENESGRSYVSPYSQKFMNSVSRNKHIKTLSQNREAHKQRINEYYSKLIHSDINMTDFSTKETYSADNLSKQQKQTLFPKDNAHRSYCFISKDLKLQHNKNHGMSKVKECSNKYTPNHCLNKVCMSSENPLLNTIENLEQKTGDLSFPLTDSSRKNSAGAHVKNEELDKCAHSKTYMAEKNHLFNTKGISEKKYVKLLFPSSDTSRKYSVGSNTKTEVQDICAHSKTPMSKEKPLLKTNKNSEQKIRTLFPRAGSSKKSFARANISKEVLDKCAHSKTDSSSQKHGMALPKPIYWKATSAYKIGEIKGAENLLNKKENQKKISISTKKISALNVKELHTKSAPLGSTRNRSSKNKKGHH